jgi:uncharacterized membrane protein
MSADPEVPSTTPPAATPPPVPASAGSGLPKNIAAGLCCVFPLLGGIIFFMLDRKDPYVRFYSIQSIGFGAILLAYQIAMQILIIMLGILHLTPVIVLIGLLSVLISLVVLAIWVISSVNAFRGKEWQIPFIWPLIKQYESRFPQ